MTTLPAPIAEDPSAREVSCAVCGTVTTIGASHSIVIVYAVTGGSRIPAYNCPAQHFCCSQECARTAAHACIDEHMIPLHAAKVQAQQGETAGGTSEQQ